MTWRPALVDCLRLLELRRRADCDGAPRIGRVAGCGGEQREGRWLVAGQGDAGVLGFSEFAGERQSDAAAAGPVTGSEERRAPRSSELDPRR